MGGVDPFASLRRSPLFDAVFYVAGLRARGQTLGELSALDHYLQRGEAAGLPPHPLFDPAYYAEHNPDVVAAGASLLTHYVENGYREGRDPHPLINLKLLRSQLAPHYAGDPLIAYMQSRGAALTPHRLVDPDYLAEQQRRRSPTDGRPTLLFYLLSDPTEVNPSAEFDGRAYLKLYPDAAGMNPLVHFARAGEAMGRQPPAERGAIARVADLIEAAGRLDPDVVKPFADVAATTLMRGYDLVRRELRLYRRLAKATGEQVYAHVILAPWLKRGGADRAVIHLARGLLESDAQLRVLIVCTQEDNLDALDWAPMTRRLTIVRVAAEIDNRHDTHVAFANYLRFAGCRHLYVVNSLFGWDLVTKYGHALRRLMRLYGFAFCQDYDPDGRRAGYAWTRLGEAIDPLDAVVSDNSRTLGEFAVDHGFDGEDAAKFFVLPLPVDERLDGVAAEQVAANLRQRERRRHSLFWAGRFTEQKGLAAAIESVQGIDGVELCAFGGTARELPAPPTGPVALRGAYEDFAELPLHEASLFLHTAHWEGLPNVILEAGAAGLPVIARDAGGVADLIDAETGWLLPREAKPADFAEAIRAVLARPDEAISRAARLAERIRRRHSTEAFAEALGRLLAHQGASLG